MFHLKKADLDNASHHDGITSTLNTEALLTASEPLASIWTNYSVPTPNDMYFTVATSSEYNAFDYKNRIYYTGVRNAIQYLFQTPAYESATIQFNADATYSIVINDNLSTDASAESCAICDGFSMVRCLKEIKRRLKDNDGRPISVTVTVDGPAGVCLIITFKPYSVPPQSPIADGGTLVETFTPAITHPYSEFESYIQNVKNWVVSQASDPISGWPISFPGGWSREQLISYIEVYNNTHQTDDVFLTQVEYYVINIMQPLMLIRAAWMLMASKTQ